MRKLEWKDELGLNWMEAAVTTQGHTEASREPVLAAAAISAVALLHLFLGGRLYFKMHEVTFHWAMCGRDVGLCTAVFLGHQTSSKLLMDADVSKNQHSGDPVLTAVKRPQEATDTLAIELVIIIMLISTVNLTATAKEFFFK